MDRSTPLAASGAVPEVSGDAAGPSRRHPELLPDEGATGGRGSREWEYQVTAAPRAGIQEPALHAAEGPAHGGDQDRIRGIQESGLKCGPRRIPAQSRFFDLAVSGGALIVLAPLLGAIAAVIRMTLGGSPLFVQSRVGMNERIFAFYKFRTMTEARDKTGELLADQPRLTTLGRFLRSTSLDELPQLWNVLTVDMSLVGPRPLLPEYLPRYNVQQRRRHEVKPGITGWAQVNGRNSLTWEQKFELDVWYVDHWNLWLDVKILWLTVRK